MSDFCTGQLAFVMHRMSGRALMGTLGPATYLWLRRRPGHEVPVCETQRLWAPFGVLAFLGASNGSCSVLPDYHL